MVENKIIQNEKEQNLLRLAPRAAVVEEEKQN